MASASHPKRRRITLSADGPVPPWMPMRSVLVNGYVLLSWHIGGDRYDVYEHRLIAKAPDSSVVHHKNGIKTDNRPENLEVLSSHSVHVMEKHGPTFDVQEAAELYRVGWSHKRLAVKYGVHHTNISRSLRRRGVFTRPQSHTVGIREPLGRW